MKSLFRAPKPRTFHHEMIYADERKQRLGEPVGQPPGNGAGDTAETSLHRHAEGKVPYRLLGRGVFSEAASGTRRRRAALSRGSLQQAMLPIIILIIFLLALWRVLL